MTLLCRRCFVVYCLATKSTAKTAAAKRGRIKIMLSLCCAISRRSSSPRSYRPAPLPLKPLLSTRATHPAPVRASNCNSPRPSPPLRPATTRRSSAGPKERRQRRRRVSRRASTPRISPIPVKLTSCRTAMSRWWNRSASGSAVPIVRKNQPTGLRCSATPTATASPTCGRPS